MEPHCKLSRDALGRYLIESAWVCQSDLATRWAATAVRLSAAARAPALGGLVINRKRAHRLYKEERLAVRVATGAGRRALDDPALPQIRRLAPALPSFNVRFPSPPGHASLCSL